MWQLEGITERPWITRRRADMDAETNSENLLRMIALKERLPDLIIVPAHDMRALQKCRVYLRQAREPSLETKKQQDKMRLHRQRLCDDARSADRRNAGSALAVLAGGESRGQCFVATRISDIVSR